MKVLLLNRIPHQTPLLYNVCNNMLRHNIEVDLLNFKNGLYYSSRNKKISIFYKSYRMICSFNKVRKVFNRYFLKTIITNIARNYDIIDIQGLFSPQYIKIIPALKQKGKKIKITIWGSDFYRQVAGTQEEVSICYDYCDIIQMATPQMKSDFVNVFPQFENKIRIIHFGLSQLETLKTLVKDEEHLDDAFLEIPKDKVVITCGYNAASAQQHKVIIDAIKRLPIDYQNKLYLLFPMTYGEQNGYINKIDSLLKSTKIYYKLLSKRLSLNELLTLRIKTGIAVNIQKTDAFAASIQEHIMAGNLLVVGDWLPYQILDENGIFVRRTSLEDLTTNIKWAIDNYLSLQETLKKNQERMYHLSSWKYVSEKWANIYQELA